MIFGCKEDAVTEPTEYEITISGIITEFDGNGLHPSENAIVHLMDSCAYTSNYLYDTTDQSGEFIFKTGTETFDVGCLDSFRLKVSKRGYVSVAKWFGYSKDQKIEMELTKLGIYFPIKVGNIWEYEALGSHGDGTYQWIYNGTEKLKITDQYNDSSFTITCLVNGSEISKSPIESDRTTYINNKKYELNIKFENGKPILINCDSCSSSNYPVLRNMLRDYSLNFYYPASVDTIKVEYGNQWDGYNYSLLINVGLTNFNSSYFDGLYAKSMSYKLINYDLK